MRHVPFTAVYDACVLYPAPLRDFLMWLGLPGSAPSTVERADHPVSVLNRPDRTDRFAPCGTRFLVWRT